MFKYVSLNYFKNLIVLPEQHLHIKIILSLRLLISVSGNLHVSHNTYISINCLSLL
jgi:hypothetical protein